MAAAVALKDRSRAPLASRSGRALRGRTQHVAQVLAGRDGARVDYGAENLGHANLCAALVDRVLHAAGGVRHLRRLAVGGIVACSEDVRRKTGLSCRAGRPGAEDLLQGATAGTAATLLERDCASCVAARNDRSDIGARLDPCVAGCSRVNEPALQVSERARAGDESTRRTDDIPRAHSPHVNRRGPTAPRNSGRVGAWRASWLTGFRALRWR